MAASMSKSTQVSNEPVELSRFVLLHLRCMQALGLCPISLHLRRDLRQPSRQTSNSSQQQQQQQQQHQRSRKRHLAWLCVHWIAFTLLHLSTVLRQKTLLYTGDNFGKFNDVLKLILAYIAHHITLCETLLKHQAMHDFLLQYSQLHRTWTTGDNKQEAHIYRRFLYHCACFLLVNIGIEFNYIMQIYHRSQWIQFFSVFIPSVLICRFRLLQFMFYVQLIECEVVQLNQRIVHLATYTRSLYRNGIRISGTLEAEICAELKSLLQNYAKIHNMAEILKQCTGWSIVVIYIKVYIKILSDLYWSYWVIYNQQLDVGLSTGFLITVPSAVTLFQLFLTSRNCMRTIETIAHNVHKLRHQVEELNISTRIMNFSLHLLHQPICIDAHGLFIINCNMVRGMLSSITTFMLFYIQFMPKFKNI